MKRQIRQGVFETNSSSTHSICIAKDVELSTPDQIHFEFGEFGWECRTLKSIEQKASYLYTGMIAEGRDDDFSKLLKILKSKGIDVSFEEKRSNNSWDNGYVDHSDELKEFIDAICKDEGKFMRFLFSPLSFIITGNDNDDEDVDIKVSYPCDEYYKGN